MAPNWTEKKAWWYDFWTLVAAFGGVLLFLGVLFGAALGVIAFIAVLL